MEIHEGLGLSLRVEVVLKLVELGKGEIGRGSEGTFQIGPNAY